MWLGQRRRSISQLRREPLLSCPQSLMRCSITTGHSIRRVCCCRSGRTRVPLFTGFTGYYVCEVLFCLDLSLLAGTRHTRDYYYHELLSLKQLQSGAGPTGIWTLVQLSNPGLRPPGTHRHVGAVEIRDLLPSK